MCNSGLSCLGQLPTPSKYRYPSFLWHISVMHLQKKGTFQRQNTKTKFERRKTQKISQLCVSHIPLPHLCFISYRCNTRQHVSYLLLKTGTFPNGKNSPELNFINRNKGCFPQWQTQKCYHSSFWHTLPSLYDSYLIRVLPNSKTTRRNVFEKRRK